MVNVMYSKNATSGNATMHPIKQIDKRCKSEFLSNRIMLESFNYLNCEIQHTLCFTNVVFCDTFFIGSVTGNENIIVENCTFNKHTLFEDFKNSKLIIRNCAFNDELCINEIAVENLEIFNTAHHNDMILNKSDVDVCFTSKVKMIGNHFFFFRDSNIRYSMKD